MNMMARYDLERENLLTIEDDKGFIQYIIKDDECYIKTIYVLPEFRREGHAFFLGNVVQEIAKKNGCTKLTGSIVPSYKGATESMLGQIKFGFRIHSSVQDFIVLIKEI